MGPARFSSGHTAADRRAEFAEALAEIADFASAAETLAGALDLAPSWTAGWYRLGEFHHGADALEDAARAWRRAIALDPSDQFGARAKLELVTGERVADTLPPAFVEALFDQYAPRFEAALVGKLAYRGPDLLMDALAAAGFTHAPRALDLGCGTGLMGAALRPACTWLEGVDLSAGMLAVAARRGIYDRLVKAEIATLPLDETGYDLIAAADVFAYMGALEPVMAWCAGSLIPGGRLAFTVEAGKGAGYVLQDSRRYAHSRDYLQTLLVRAGFEAAQVTPCVVRRDRGADIASFAVTALRAGLARTLESDGEAEVSA